MPALTSAAPRRPRSRAGGHEHYGDQDRGHEQHERLSSAGTEGAGAEKRRSLNGQRHEQKAGQSTSNAAKWLAERAHATGVYPTGF